MEVEVSRFPTSTRYPYRKWKSHTFLLLFCTLPRKWKSHTFLFLLCTLPWKWQSLASTCTLSPYKKGKSHTFLLQLPVLCPTHTGSGSQRLALSYFYFLYSAPPIQEVEVNAFLLLLPVLCPTHAGSGSLLLPAQEVSRIKTTTSCMGGTERDF